MGPTKRALQTLQHAGWNPDLVAGTSTGTIKGATIAAAGPEEAVAGLQRFWSNAPGRSDAAGAAGAGRGARGPGRRALTACRNPDRVPIFRPSK